MGTIQSINGKASIYYRNLLFQSQIHCPDNWLLLLDTLLPTYRQFLSFSHPNPLHAIGENIVCTNEPNLFGYTTCQSPRHGVLKRACIEPIHTTPFCSNAFNKDFGMRAGQNPNISPFPNRQQVQLHLGVRPLSNDNVVSLTNHRRPQNQFIQCSGLRYFFMVVNKSLTCAPHAPIPVTILGQYVLGCTATLKGSSILLHIITCSTSVLLFKHDYLPISDHSTIAQLSVLPIHIICKLSLVLREQGKTDSSEK